MGTSKLTQREQPRQMRQKAKHDLACKSYFGADAVVLLSRVLRLSFSFSLLPKERHSVTVGLLSLAVKRVTDGVEQTNRQEYMSACTFSLSLIVKLHIQGP